MKRKTIIPKRLPRIHPPDAQEREYMRLILIYQREYERQVREGLKELIPTLKEVAGQELPHTDSVDHFDVNIPRALGVMFELIGKRMKHQFPDDLLTRWAKHMIGNTNTNAKKNVKKVAEVVDINVEPLLRDDHLNPYFQNVVDENVALIRSIPENSMASFKNALTNAITQDLHNSTISEIIQKNFGTTRAKARLIARDQVGKLNGKLTQYRQEQLGGKRYVWRTSEDERVRKDHERLDGKTFFWDKPPVINRSTGARGNPGQDIQCRCHAEMVLEDVVQ